MEKKSLNTGEIIEVTPDIFKQAANDFSEGNENLKKLLTFCFENGIKTRACCSGHNGEKEPYILFDFSHSNMEAILKILKGVSLNDAVEYFGFRNQPEIVSNFSVSIKKDKSNEGFDQILKALKSKEEIKLEDIDETKQLILKSIQNHSIPYSYLEIRERDNKVFIAANEEYWEIFSLDQETTEWLENTIAGEYKKNSKEAMKALKILESNTKNYRYSMIHPYDKDKINNYMRNRGDKTNIELNGVATRERQFEYNERNVLVFEPAFGSNIFDIAVEMMNLSKYGQACILKFNSFVIDTRDYKDYYEVLKAYIKYIKDKRKNTNKSSAKQNEVTPTEIEEIISRYPKVQREIYGMFTENRSDGNEWIPYVEKEEDFLGENFFGDE